MAGVFAATSKDFIVTNETVVLRRCVLLVRVNYIDCYAYLLFHAYPWRITIKYLKFYKKNLIYFYKS